MNWLEQCSALFAVVCTECVEAVWKVNNIGLTVPSPPHARILRLGTLAYSSNLQETQSKAWTVRFKHLRLKVLEGLLRLERSVDNCKNWGVSVGYRVRTGAERKSGCMCVYVYVMGQCGWSYPSLGPPFVRSNTCRGFRYHMKDWLILAPWNMTTKNRSIWGKKYKLIEPHNKDKMTLIYSSSARSASLTRPYNMMSELVELHDKQLSVRYSFAALCVGFFFSLVILETLKPDR